MFVTCLCIALLFNHVKLFCWRVRVANTLGIIKAVGLGTATMQPPGQSLTWFTRSKQLYSQGGETEAAVTLGSSGRNAQASGACGSKTWHHTCFALLGNVCQRWRNLRCRIAHPVHPINLGVIGKQPPARPGCGSGRLQLACSACSASGGGRNLEPPSGLNAAQLPPAAVARELHSRCNACTARGQAPTSRQQPPPGRPVELIWMPCGVTVSTAPAIVKMVVRLPWRTSTPATCAGHGVVLVRLGGAARGLIHTMPGCSGFLWPLAGG